MDNKLSCNKHGSSNATFICQHLASEEGLGFNLGYYPDNPYDLCSEAWCNKCCSGQYQSDTFLKEFSYSNTEHQDQTTSADVGKGYW